MNKEAKQRCFVIMPFSQTTERHTEEYWNKHYNEFLKPIIESHSLFAHRSSPLRGDILRQIITDLVTAPIVVADLTDANPNVYWELGIRQSFKHGTITIAEDGTSLPFDLGVKGSLYYYPGDHIKMMVFSDKFNDAINDCLNNPTSPDSHVLETISGRGTLFQILLKGESLRKLDALLNEVQNNLAILRHIKNTCTSNATLRKGGNEKDVECVTSRLRIPALEYLIVNRYIDASKKFYRTAELYLDDCISINTQLTFCDLADDSEIGEDWLLSHLNNTRKLFISFKRLLAEQINIITLSL